jgi:hypothetical protein
MKGCDDYSATVQLYLDRELSGHDLKDFALYWKNVKYNNNTPRRLLLTTPPPNGHT